MIRWPWIRWRRRDDDLETARRALAVSTARRKAVERTSPLVHARAGKLRQLATENNLAPIVAAAIRARQ